jgi:NAD+ kinase
MPDLCMQSDGRLSDMKINKIVVVINRSKPHARRTAEVLKRVLDREKIEQRWVETLPPGANLYRKLHDLETVSADLVVACGGDGTVLQTAHRIRGSGIPILGINIGYLGFITSIPGDRVRHEMRRILNNEFVVSERTALDLTVVNKGKRLHGWALNDAIVTRGDNPHLIDVVARVGKRPLTHYRCDGLIVATPTGSTAYSLAAGGPIISPECNVLTITPICPQALTNRSLVVNSTEPIQMTLAESSGQGLVQVDGMTLAKTSPTSVIEVETSKNRVAIAFLPEINYYDVLAEKLQWRGDGLSKPNLGQ